MVFQYDDGQPVVENLLRDLPATRVDGLTLSGPKAKQENEYANEHGKESHQFPPYNHRSYSCERRTCLQGEGEPEREGKSPVQEAGVLVHPFPFGVAKYLGHLAGLGMFKQAVDRLFFCFTDAPHSLFVIGQDADKRGGL